MSLRSRIKVLEARAPKPALDHGPYRHVTGDALVALLAQRIRAGFRGPSDEELRSAGVDPAIHDAPLIARLRETFESHGRLR